MTSHTEVYLGRFGQYAGCRICQFADLEIFSFLKFSRSHPESLHIGVAQTVRLSLGESDLVPEAEVLLELCFHLFPGQDISYLASFFFKHGREGVLAHILILQNLHVGPVVSGCKS